MIKLCAMIGAPDLEQDTLAVYQGNLQEGFEKVASLGYKGVELMMKNPRQLNGEAISAWAEANGLDVVGLCTGHVFGEDKLGLVGPDPEVCAEALRRCREFIDFAGGSFGEGTFVNIGRFRGMGFPGDVPRTLAEMERVFREIAEYASPRGVRLVLEPITVNQTRYINTTRDGVGMVDRVARENFGLMLDVYHMNIEDDDIYESFRLAGKRCWFVHLTDNNRKHPGSGHLDFRRIVETLEQIGYNGYASMEILPWPDPDTAARAALEHMRKYISP